MSHSAHFPWPKTFPMAYRNSPLMPPSASYIPTRDTLKAIGNAPLTGRLGLSLAQHDGHDDQGDPAQLLQAGNLEQGYQADQDRGYW